MARVRLARAGLAWALLAAGCTEATPDAGSSAGDATPATDGGVVLDAAPAADGASPLDGGEDGGTPDAPGADVAPGRDAFDPGPAPAAPLVPRFGELSFIQLYLPAGLVSLGEAALIVGPDGTIVLVDAGNDSHDDEIKDALATLNTRDLVPARGYSARTRLQVEWVLLTHLHADHIGGVTDLFTGPEPLELVHGVIHRGAVDLGPGANEGDYQRLCQLLAGPLARHDRPLCAAAAPAGCTFGGAGAPYPALDCPGLMAGSLLDPADQGPSFLPLGGAARLELLLADGFASDGAGVVAAPAFGHEDSNQENARSLAGLVRHGAFRLHFAGDLTGSGDSGEPDVESHLASVAGPHFYQTLGVDVVHANHHARRTSSNATFVDALAPLDGRPRNVLAGINAAYVNSPHQEVLDAWTAGGRLATGRFWVTDVAPNGASGGALVDAGRAPVIVQTVQGGRGYWVQAAGTPLISRAYPSLRD